MKVKKLTVNQVKNLVSNVKAIYRLNGFVTGKRTNLQKATKECKCDLFQMYETKYLIVVGLGYCNIYRLAEKTESEKFKDQSCMIYNGDSKKAVLDYNDKKIELTCTLLNTKVCKWNDKYPESHNHYIVKFKYGISFKKTVKNKC